MPRVLKVILQKRVMLVCALAFLLPLACSNTQEVLDVPEPISRQVAISQLEEILNLYTYKVKRPKVCDSTLNWQYQVHDPEMRWVDRQLDLTKIVELEPPVRLSNSYGLSIITENEEISFQVETRDQALLLYADLRYLWQNSPE